VDWSPGYREVAPPAGLAHAVSCVWVGVTPADGAPPTRVLPDACVDLIWQRGVGVFLAGPDTGPVLMPLPPGSVLAGVRLRPGAGGPALRRPLTGLLDQRPMPADLRAELGRDLGGRLVTEVPGELSPDVALRRLVRLTGELVTSAPPDPLIMLAAQRLARPDAQVRDVAAELAISERQLNRRCCAAIGYGPALLRRVLRFRRFVSRIDAAPAAVGLAGLAVETGYADQAHLTRDSSELAGLPPLALIRDRHGVPG
jgi:Domain of unknown function (DUF6597)